MLRKKGQQNYDLKGTVVSIPLHVPRETSKDSRALGGYLQMSNRTAHKPTHKRGLL